MGSDDRALASIGALLLHSSPETDYEINKVYNHARSQHFVYDAALVVRIVAARGVPEPESAF